MTTNVQCDEWKSYKSNGIDIQGVKGAYARHAKKVHATFMHNFIVMMVAVQIREVAKDGRKN